jgi:hypothetical protein
LKTPCGVIIAAPFESEVCWIALRDIEWGIYWLQRRLVAASCMLLRYCCFVCGSYCYFAAGCRASCLPYLSKGWLADTLHLLWDLLLTKKPCNSEENGSIMRCGVWNIYWKMQATVLSHF